MVYYMITYPIPTSDDRFRARFSEFYSIHPGVICICFPNETICVDGHDIPVQEHLFTQLSHLQLPRFFIARIDPRTMQSGGSNYALPTKA
ncbi:MAG: hypothetical protein RL095_249 [Verrucomicrobiota bacterium]|jgi:hypothetical protein